MGGTLTANSHDEVLDPVTDPMSMPTSEPPQLLSRQTDDITASSAAATPTTQPPAGPSDNSLAGLEQSVDSPHLEPANVDAARDEVDRALSGSTTDETTPPEPIEALNAQPMGGELHPSEAAASMNFGPNPGPSLNDILGKSTPAPPPPPADPQSQPPASSSPPPDSTASTTDSGAPPPVPPPIPFQFGSTPPPAQ